MWFLFRTPSPLGSARQETQQTGGEKVQEVSAFSQKLQRYPPISPERWLKRDLVFTEGCCGPQVSRGTWKRTSKRCQTRGSRPTESNTPTVTRCLTSTDTSQVMMKWSMSEMWCQIPPGGGAESQSCVFVHVQAGSRCRKTTSSTAGTPP